MNTVEHERLSSAGAPEGPLSEAGPWNLWGPYLSERAWGTVREDYSPDGSAWDWFPHDHARSRVYRWNEDGMAGISDIFQRLCLSLALWNGRDAFIKERMFGLAGPQGNHGEDAKDYWWYLDALPSHALLRWRYHYPQQAFPYDDLVSTNAARGKLEPEYELLDTGVFDHGTWIVEVTFAKVEPTDILMRITVRNVGTATERIHVLPHLWFRNTWDWEPGSPKPSIGVEGDDLIADHPTLGRYRLQAAPGPDGALPTPLFCENETNVPRVFGAPATTPYPKDGINDHVVSRADTVNPDKIGTKAALRYVADIAPGETAVFDVRLRDDAEADALGAVWSGDVATATLHERQVEADEFYGTIAPEGTTPDEALVMRQGFAGMIWSKQFYPYDLSRWLDGDPGQPPPPEQRKRGRNANWRHVQSNDVLSMPDPWEYPWFAAWDLAFHTVVLAHVDPTFAKYQLIALTREWFMHPNGALPAYEWSFDDVNPPVHAWAAWRVFQIDGSKDHAFLARIFHKLLINFTWWVNRQDAEGNNLFEGGFLGLDNIGPFDRSHMPVPGTLEQSDGTGWMAAYCLGMLGISLELAKEDPSYDTLVTKFLEHFAQIASAMNEQGLWDEEDGTFYDRLSAPDGTAVSMRYRSIVGVMPVLASAGLATGQVGSVINFRKRFAASVERQRGERSRLGTVGGVRAAADGDHVLLSVVNPDQLRRLLTDVLDEESLLSPYGLRSISRRHLEHPFTVEVDGVTATVDYEPGESTSGMFGGNSNWRGPVWFPVNHLILEALERYQVFVGDDYTVECPTGSGQMMTLREVAMELRRRLISIFLAGPDGRRPLYGSIDRYATDPDWQGLIEFHEYFHGDTGFGIGASHQTGWTGLVAHLIASAGDDQVGTARFAKAQADRGPEPAQS